MSFNSNPRPAEVVSPNEKPSTEPQVLTVSDLNKAVKNNLENGFRLIWLRGEISNYKPHSSGHWYFCLKDSKSQINAVMFRGFNQAIRFPVEDGMEVLVRGKLTVYEPRGNYQIFCELMEPVGAGALQIAFEKLKAKLKSEGLFEAARKRELPSFPKHVAVVTSPTGAAIRDIINVLGRRSKGLRVTVVPAIVQGDQAPLSIIAAIKKAQCLTDVDVLIIGRGGGSVEDLWAFNDERVVREIAASRVPTISAVGHEIDFTIADFVADLRAPTPSAAAELVVKSVDELSERLRLTVLHLRKVCTHQLELLKRQVKHASQRLVDPKRRVQDLSLRCDDLTARLEQAITRHIHSFERDVAMLMQKLGSPKERLLRYHQELEIQGTLLNSYAQMALDRSQARLSQLAALLDSLSPLRVLDRGYSIVSSGAKVLTKANQVNVGDPINVRLGSGKLTAKVLKIEMKE